MLDHNSRLIGNGGINGRSVQVPVHNEWCSRRSHGPKVQFKRSMLMRAVGSFNPFAVEGQQFGIRLVDAGTHEPPLSAMLKKGGGAERSFQNDLCGFQCIACRIEPV